VTVPRLRTRLRVAYIDHCAQLSGAQLALKRLLDAFDGEVDPTVLLAEDGPLAASLREGGRAVDVIPWTTAARRLRGVDIRLASSVVPAARTAAYARRLGTRLHQLQPDLVHTNSLKAAVYGPLAARLAGVPVLVQVRDRITPDFLPTPARRLVRLAMGTLPDALAGNETTLPTLGVTRVPQFVIVDPVDPCCFDVAPGPRPTHPLRVGMVGRIAPWKGQHVFLRAFAQAFPAGDACAVLVGAPLFGEHDYERELHALAGTLGIRDRVEFRGFRRDVPAELQRLDVAVHASVIPEPFGQVVTEAMAAGLPVVAARAGGPARIIDDRRSGLLTPPGDVEALAAALGSLAADPELRGRLGQAARRRARDFSSDVAARQALDAYHSVVALSRSAPFRSAGRTPGGCSPQARRSPPRTRTS